MSFYRHLLKRTSSFRTTLSTIPHVPTLFSTTPLRTFAFSSAEEAAAERRRRKRRLRIEPPLHALRRDPNAPRPKPDPNAPRLPDTTSALVGVRLNLHNRVQTLIRAGDLDAAAGVAKQAVFSNTRPTVFTGNAIMAAMYRAGRYNDAKMLFKFFYNQNNIVPNIVSYNFLIVTHCEDEEVDIALDVYKHILEHAPYSPSSVTYRHLTKGLVEADRIGDAVDLLREMLNKNHGADSLVYNNVIKGFLDLGNEGRANELFDELKERCLVYDGVVNATYMEYFFEKEMDKEAMNSYNSLLDRNFNMTPATCNVLLEVLIKNGKKSEAAKLFQHMLDGHKLPNTHTVNSATFNIMVNECFRLGDVEGARATFRAVGTKEGAKPIQMDALMFNNMMEKLIEHGFLGEAEELFEEMPPKQANRDVNTYKILADGYLKEDRIEDLLTLFNKQVFGDGVKANAAFYNKIFGALLSKGKIDEIADILKRMGELEVKPNADVYEFVISGLCKEERLDHAWDLLCQMVKNRILINPSLRSTIDESFGKGGRTDDIVRLLGRPVGSLPQHQQRPGPYQPDPAPYQHGHMQHPQGPPAYRQGFAQYPQSPLPYQQGSAQEQEGLEKAAAASIN